ncbi:hypothetical protein B0H15DRAFT_817753 [Mycena belliarum]|uniref:Uncharacterized protein n=1 Tax=Mycena belliarum TaxID=1033014 RepID=A0AAD6UEQ8_9AGAR|nr:hypothetical protein B0H15DRAFT_817418 [Mycena belliae]KAJ7100920.1 hypothetical protein B0H15DRAFT_817753 [Mycena belliae]
MLPCAVLSPAPLKHETEPHPILGIDVRCNSRRAVTRITPFQERVDPSVDFFYKPITRRPRVRCHPEGADKRRASEYAAGGAFLAFALIQFRDGPLLCPHPALRGQGAPCPLPCFASIRTRAPLCFGYHKNMALLLARYSHARRHLSPLPPRFFDGTGMFTVTSISFR